LLVKHSNEKSINSKEISITNLYPLINKVIIAIYRNGAEQVKINFEKPEMINSFRKALNELLGFEVTEQGKHYCIVKEIMKTSELEFDRLFNRIFFLLRNSFQDTINALKEKDHETLKSIFHRDIDINKLASYCLRHINKKGYKDYEKSHSLFATVHQLESIGDNLKQFTNFVAEEKPSYAKDCIGVFEDIAGLLDALHKVLQKNNLENAKAVSKIYDKLKTKIKNNLEQSKNKKEAVFLMHCRVLTENIILMSDINMGFINV
ncbi:hypothetical protein KY312_03045, partial [Candidatus Woesearchaeota archaeon]|nr:hypothetical protein [Candidatus Woesearchaeota archaeon]